MVVEVVVDGKKLEVVDVMMDSVVVDIEADVVVVVVG